MTSNNRPTTQFVWACLLWLISASAIANTFTATVDRTQLGTGETLELQLRYDAQTTSDPDLSVLNQNFEVLSQQQQNKFSIINGSTNSYTEWRIQLLPRTSGSVIIPPIALNGVHSNVITLKITDTPKDQKSNQPVFIETALDKTSAYVQEQLILTYRLYSTTNLKSISSEELMVKNASLMKLSENQYQKLINGVNHLVVELKYALFPEASGELKIPAVRFNTVIPDRRDPYSNPFFSRGGKRIYLHTDEKSIDIKPKPDSFGSGEWLPTRAVNINQRWSRSLDELVAGEPITRTLFLSAQGLTAAQLPPIEITAGDGFKTYPDQPQLNNDVTSDGVMGTRIESIAIVPSRGGEITLPAITLKWWDTHANLVRETTLPEQILTVMPAENTQLTMADPPGNSAVNHPVVSNNTEQQEAPLISNTLVGILLSTNALLLGIVVFLFVRLRRSRNKQSGSENALQSDSNDVKETSLFRDLKRSANKEDINAFREALLQWANTFWQQPVVTLDTLALLVDDSTVATELKALDQQLYSPTTAKTVQLQNIITVLEAVRKQQNRKKSDKGNHLEPLYGH